MASSSTKTYRYRLTIFCPHPVHVTFSDLYDSRDETLEVASAHVNILVDGLTKNMNSDNPDWWKIGDAYIDTSAITAISFQAIRVDDH